MKNNIKKLDTDLQKLASSFCSGNSELDGFLKGPDALNDSFGKTYLWLSESNQNIIGYFNIGTGYIEDVNDRVKMGGSIHLNNFAIDEHFQKVKVDIPGLKNQNIVYADILLGECIRIIRNIRKENVGFSFITLCSTKEGYNLYKRNDFEELDEEMDFTQEFAEYDCIPMYYAMDYEP